MWYVLRKIALSFLTIFAISLLVFFMFQVIPGDPVLSQFGMDDLTEYLAERMRYEFELDTPVIWRYLNWVRRVLRGDLGQSFQFRTGVAGLISSRLQPTFSLAFLSMGVVVLVGIPLGVYIANNAHRKRGAAASVTTQVFMAVPSFWLAIILMWIFAFRLNFASIRVTVNWSDPIATIRALSLPVIALSLGGIAVIVRYVCTSVLEQKNSEYVKAACAKGLTDRQVIKRHVLKNALAPVITVLGLTFISLLTGSIIIENVFVISGIGSLLIGAINHNDYPLIQGIVLYYSIVVVLVGLVVDAIHAFIDPRIRKKKVIASASRP